MSAHGTADRTVDRSVERRNDALPSNRPFKLVLAVTVIFACWLGTEYVAYRAGYSPVLGPWAYLAGSGARMWWRAAAAALALMSIGSVIGTRAMRRTRPWAAPASAVALFIAIAAFVTSLGPLYAPHDGIVWAFRFDHAIEHTAERGSAHQTPHATSPTRSTHSTRVVRSTAVTPRAAHRAAEPAARYSQTTAPASRRPDREGLSSAVGAPRSIASLAAMAHQGILVSGAALVILMSLVILVRPKPKRLAPSTSHGSATWGDGAPLVGPVGLVLGRSMSVEKPRRSRNGAGQTAWQSGLRSALRYNGEGHVLTVAPTRSGKGVGCVIPNLLDYPGSVLVTDPKGENYAVTARARRMLGQTVHALDPFDVVGGTAAFNPLDLIDAESADAIDDARLIADMLVAPDAKGGSAGGDFAHWNEEARALLAGITLYVSAKAPRELRTLSHVRELLTLAPESFRLLLQDMLECEDAGGLIQRAAARHLQKADRERSGVVSAAQSHTHFLDSPRMARVLGRSTFQFDELKTPRRESAASSGMSVYLVLPPDRMDSYHRWLRIMVACAVRSMMRAPDPPAQCGTRSGLQPDARVVFILDEFAHLGRMQPVERDIGIAGGYGLTLWLLVQDLAQLKGLYPEKWQSFLANSAVFQAFGTNDWDTAEYLSKMTGETTILVESENQSSGVSHGQHAQRQRGAAFTTSEKGRRLLTPDEVLRLPLDQELLFIRGQSPIRASKLDYRLDEMLLARADPNPMHGLGQTVEHASKHESTHATLPHSAQPA